MYEQDAKTTAQMIGKNAGQVSAPATAMTFLMENGRLIKEAHEAVSQLESKLDPLLPKSEAAGIAPGVPSMAASSQLAGELRDQGEALAGLIRRINGLRYGADL